MQKQVFSIAKAQGSFCDVSSWSRYPVIIRVPRGTRKNTGTRILRLTQVSQGKKESRGLFSERLPKYRCPQTWTTQFTSTDRAYLV